ncbi:PilZ domain-containing protein [Pseudomaricurvus alkylphenolicus]|uniref:PilZ domain-containing protein n=1 Tax=Pseudomaricurvus alkylphenolicus TaxID=1306991 RepID=UPI00141FAA70|nr:PilZ domain-containing protein [Pseudomaricurvus alkylphenolicus]NIB39660.1 PilZ domain-containing protein [Pseudomaricurvus alkylphenolicus]
MNNHTPFDQRAVTRFRTHLPCEVRSESVVAEALLLNLSRCGLQLQSGGELVNALMPNIQRPDPHQPLRLQVGFQVETSSRENVPIGMQCQIIYTRRLAQDRFLIGCQFNDFEQGCAEDLQDYLLNFAEPMG